MRWVFHIFQENGPVRPLWEHGAMPADAGSASPEGDSPGHTVQTVTGPISTADLGRTLMHEHLSIGYAGFEAHSSRPGPDRAEMVDVCTERISQLQDLGYSSMLDPCPSDLGRDVELMVEVAEATGFNIVCATGLYKEEEGGSAYWHFKAQFEDVGAVMADQFISELTDGVGSTGVRPGIIKCATGPGAMTDYERTVFNAAAEAAVATGAPVTTHTDRGTMGELQQELLTAAGVPANRVIIGHSCGSTDTGYHMGIAAGGSYLGFDRFGIGTLMPDVDRVASLVRLLGRGAGDRLVVSHDSVWCWRGEPFPAAAAGRLADLFNPTRFDREIVPMLHDHGVTDEQVDMLVVENPRRFFEGVPLAELGT